MRLGRLTAAAGAVLLAWPAAVAAQQVPITLAPGEVLLNVEEEGVHKVRPDLMEISAGVVTTGASAKGALAANNVLAQRLLDTIRAQGVAPTDVQTRELEVRPQFDRRNDDSDDGPPRRITGYVATNKLSVRLRDLGRASDIVSALFEAGANTVSGPHFGVADEEPALRDARGAAVAAARREAEDYAAALNMRIARVLRVSERGRFDVDDGQAIVVTGSRIPRTPLVPGEITVRLTVWIDYALVPR